MNQHTTYPKEETILTGIGISSEFIGKKALWERQRAGRSRQKSKTHIALEKSIVPFEKPCVGKIRARSSL